MPQLSMARLDGVQYFSAGSFPGSGSNRQSGQALEGPARSVRLFTLYRGNTADKVLKSAGNLAFRRTVSPFGNSVLLCSLILDRKTLLFIRIGQFPEPLGIFSPSQPNVAPLNAAAFGTERPHKILPPEAAEHLPPRPRPED